MVINYFFIISILVLLGYGAITDWKTRIISDWIPIALLLLGTLQLLFLKKDNLLYVPVINRIEGFFITALILFFIYILLEGMGGGDYKLLVSLGFCLGMEAIELIVIGACIIGLFYSLISKQKSIPFAIPIFFSVLLYFLYLRW